MKLVKAQLETTDVHAGAVEILGGDLSDISLTSLLQLAQYEAISGWLCVPRRGEIVLEKGQVLDASCGTLTGVEALRELLFHRGGRFSLLRGEPRGSRMIENVTFAVMDAYRLRDEWTRIAGAVLRPAGGQMWRPTGGLLDSFAVHFDGRRTVGEAVAVAAGCTTLLLDALLDAINLGLLVRVAAPVAHTDEPDLGFYELIDRAQRLMRGGNYETAEKHLHRALALRPEDRVAQQNLRALSQRRRCA